MELGSGSNNMEVQNKKRKSRSNKNLEFVGWGSKPLIEFLDSIGKESSRKYSQGEVDTIVKKYVTSNNLIEPRNKRKILCDEKLEKLFNKKTVSRRNVYHLLEVHLRENHDDGDNVDVDDAHQDAPKSCFAAISAQNIKLIFLRLELVKGLLKENPENFEENMVGSMVRMGCKQNSNSKSSYKLHQVTGVVSQSSGEPYLRLSNVEAEVPISELSDRYFTEEELEEFHKQMKAGRHKRPTVEEFESKAQYLHRFLTKNWIDRELKSLKLRIDLANERGWRADMYYLMTQRGLLSTSAEQERLLAQKPRVAVAEPETEETAPGTSEEQEEGVIAQKPVVVGVEAELEETLSGVSAEHGEKPPGCSGEGEEEERIVCQEPIVGGDEADHVGASEKKGEEEEEGECCSEKAEQENVLIEELQAVAEEPEPEPPLMGGSIAEEEEGWSDERAAEEEDVLMRQPNAVAEEAEPEPEPTLMDTSVTEEKEEGRPEEENVPNAVAEEPEPEPPLMGASTRQEGESSSTPLDDIQREAEARANYTRRIIRAACELSAAGLTFEEEDYVRFGGSNASVMTPNPARQNYLQEFSALMMNSVRTQAQQLQQQWVQEQQQQEQRRAEALQQLQQWVEAYQQRQSSMGGGGGVTTVLGNVPSSSTTQGTVSEDPTAAVWLGADHRGYIQGSVSLNLLRIWFQQGYVGANFRVWKTGQHQSQSVLLLQLLNSLNLL